MARLAIAIKLQQWAAALHELRALFHPLLNHVYDIKTLRNVTLHSQAVVRSLQIYGQLCSMLYNCFHPWTIIGPYVYMANPIVKINENQQLNDLKYCFNG